MRLAKEPAPSSLSRPPETLLGPVSSASPSSSARPYAHFPLGSRPARVPIPSPVSISPCARAPPAPSLLPGSPARRERKVNGQPQPQRQITMRKINQKIAVCAPRSSRRTPLRPPRRERGAPGPLRLGPGRQEGRVWALQGSARARGLERIRRGALQAAAERGRPPSESFHTPSGPRVPTRLAALTLAPQGLLARPLSRSLHLGASLGASAALSPSLSFVCPLPPGPDPGPHRGLQPRRADFGAAGTQCSLDPEPAGKRQHSGRPSRGGSWRRGSLRTPTPLPAASATWFQLASAPGSLPLYPDELLKFAT